MRVPLVWWGITCLLLTGPTPGPREPVGPYMTKPEAVASVFLAPGEWSALADAAGFSWSQPKAPIPLRHASHVTRVDILRAGVPRGRHGHDSAGRRSRPGTGSMFRARRRTNRARTNEGRKRHMLVAFSVTPLGTGEAAAELVAEAGRLVRASGLPNRTHAIFPTIAGD